MVMAGVGLLIHGPEVIDEGEAREAIERLKDAGIEIKAALGGITGKTAVIDADMQDEIDISKDMRPSEVIEDFMRRGIEFVILVNRGKTEESGLLLGEGILRNYYGDGGAKDKPSFIQLEYYSRLIIPWILKQGDEELYSTIRAIFAEFKEREPYKPKLRCRRESDFEYREIGGVHAGEKIIVNGVVIGTTSCDGSITLVARDGRIVDVIGGRLIEHNLEKLPPLSLRDAMIKSASIIRRTMPKFVGKGRMREGGRKVACLFYTVEHLFPKIETLNLGVAVTIGDDTTSIAADILKRFGVPLIGITDGDADGLIAGIGDGTLEQYAKFLPSGSMVVRLKPERDDIIGERIKEEIFSGCEELELGDDVEHQIKELKRRILAIAGDDVMGVLST